MSNDLRWHQGGCHCGAVRWEVALPDTIDVEDCNCSICRMSRNAHIIVPGSRFRFLKGEETLSRYTFNTGVAQHLFCPVCGVKSVYIPRSNPDGYGVTWRCLDDPYDFTSIREESFDGVNWEANAGTLAHKSQD